MADLAKPLQILEIIGPVDDYILEYWFTVITNHGRFRLKMDINTLFEIDLLADAHGREKARNMVFARKLEEALKKQNKELDDGHV